MANNTKLNNICINAIFLVFYLKILVKKKKKPTLAILQIFINKPLLLNFYFIL